KPVTNLDPARPQYARAAIPARLALERGAWKEAAALTPIDTNFPYTDANIYFARALGAARSGDLAAADQGIEALRSLHKKLLEAGNTYWAGEVEVSGLAAYAWTLLARGNVSEAEERMRQAADVEDRREKNVTTPGRMLPARELLGDMLLELKRPAEALKEYE